MTRLGNLSIGVEQGSEILFSDFNSDGPMWGATGTRETRTTIRFAEPFLATPVVQLSLTMWDVAHESNHRVDLSAAAISATGFQIVFRTWADTRIARVRADWMALGEIASEDDIL